MYFVFVFHCKKLKQTFIGFSQDVNESLKNQNEKYGSKNLKWLLTHQEKYKSKKDALIRVKMLKKQYKIR